MRNTYLILTFLTQMTFLAGIIFAPIYVTPGWYFWSIMFGVLFIANAIGLTARINEWNEMDSNK